MKALKLAIAACLLALVTCILDRDYYECLGTVAILN